MTYEKPGIEVLKFDFTEEIASNDFLSSNINTGPIIEGNDPLIESLEKAFRNVFNI